MALLGSCLALLSTTVALAQSGGLVVLILEGETRETIPGASVLLENSQQLIAPTTASSDADGRVEFPVLKIGGGYIVEVSAPGFARQRLGDIRVVSGRTEEVVLLLSPELQENVRVRGRREVVDIEKAHDSTRFSDEFIEALPVPGRFYQNILQLAPGVNDADGDGNPNVHGARTRDFRAEVSGVANVDPLTGERLSFVSHESIEEIEIIQSGAGAEFGRAQGAFARITQKQGTNLLEGVFSFLFSSSELDGAGATNLPDDQIPDFDRYQPALQLSGPLVRDKLWYRLSHEHIDQEEPINVIGRVAISEVNQWIHSDQLTWQVTPRNKLSFQFQSDPLKRTNLDVSSTLAEESSRSIDQQGETYSLSWVTPISPRLLVDSLVAYQDHTVEIFPSDPENTQDCAFFPFFETLNSTRCLHTNTAQTSGPYPETWDDKRQRLTVRSQATWHVGRFLGAIHQLKAGFTIENERYYRTLERAADIRFLSFPGNYFVPPTGIAAVELPVPRHTDARATATNVGLYLEDRIRPSDGLVVTLGLRIDRGDIQSRGQEPLDPDREVRRFRDFLALGADPEDFAVVIFTAWAEIAELRSLVASALNVPNETIPLSNSAIQAAFWRNERGIEGIGINETTVSPRISVAWNPFSNGKTKLAASWGRYYDKVFLAVPLVEMEPLTVDFTFRAQGSSNSDRFFITQLNGGLVPVLDVRQVDRELTTPYQDEFVASFETGLWPETSLKLSWVRRRFKDQFQDRDINHRRGRVLSPIWGEVLQLGNYNDADYDAYVVELTRRQYRGWQMNASYIWSEAVGDAEDFNQLLGNNVDLLQYERSYLSYDQRHIFRLNAGTITPWGYRLGAIIRWESGLPYSLVESRMTTFENPPEYSSLGAPVTQIGFDYPTGRRNDQRNESFWTFDTRIAKEFNRGGMNIQLTAEIFNLMNDDRLALTDTIDDGISATRRYGRRYQVGLRLAF